MIEAIVESLIAAAMFAGGFAVLAIAAAIVDLAIRRPKPRQRPDREPVDFLAEIRRVGPLVPWSEIRITNNEARSAATAGPLTTHGGPHESLPHK